MHKSVLLKESINNLNLKKGHYVIDCTTNRGGHSFEIAKIIGKDGILICIDLDSEALKEAEEFLNKNLKANERPRIFFVQDNFRNIKSILKKIEKNISEKGLKIDAIIADLGVSSQEIDNSNRGFTFQKDEDILMTFKDKKSLLKTDLTAKEILNNWEEKNLADIIYYYGDEKYAKRIAKKICEERIKKEIKTTFDLIKIIELSIPAFYKNKKNKTHFATRTFQALRIAVNDELLAEKDLLESLNDVLKTNSRASIITFHSGEDRIIKNFIKENKNDFKLIKFENKKDFIQPSIEEIKNNNRSRSAKLRVLEKL